MIHDPMCPYKVTLAQAVRCGGCDLIRRVREAPRGPAVSDIDLIEQWRKTLTGGVIPADGVLSLEVTLGELMSLVRLAREDERQYRLNQSWSDDALVQQARDAALRDAAQAVEALAESDLYYHYRMTCEPPHPVDWSKHQGGCDPIDDVVAAIRALVKEDGA